MKLKFDPNQEFQLRAIESAAEVFEGQPRTEDGLEFAKFGGFAAVPNRLDLDENALLKNLQAVQAKNLFPADEELKTIEEKIETANGAEPTKFPNFSVEMETGTGKTYVYIRTALELNRRYGFRKFIIVVPSVAVREGVIKTFEITREHLEAHYGNTPYRHYAYKSANLSQIRQFALSTGIEFMVMTIDSFNKELNVIRQSTDRLQGEVPLHLVQTTRPILILDEPQNMESEKSVRALAGLNPLFALRYSATHRNPYNVIFKLTPFDAYRQGLVKKIEVASTAQSDDESRVFMRLDKIESKKNVITAKLTVHKLMRNGTVKEASITVKPGDKLKDKAGRGEYGSFEVAEINPGSEFVEFSNGAKIELGETKGEDKAAIFKAQVRYTIEEHFRKQAKLKDQGIKVLSLFFIDRVSNYADEDGIIRRLFASEFKRLQGQAQYAQWKEVEVEKVQAAYFAQSRKKGGEVILEDSTTGKAKKDEDAYDLIMKDKEKLLSFDEPVSFIFSHSALREGWDNPNVFQICTLNQTASEMKKRQEIGRGIRLAVDQAGERTHDEKINVLTVVANESYERYVERLQGEIEEEYGKEGLPPKPANARKRGAAKLRKQMVLKPEFKELWERIKHKTRYAVKIDSARLIGEVVEELNQAEIQPPRVTITKARIEVGESDQFEAARMTAARTVEELAARPLPNLVGVMKHLMEQANPPSQLTRRTLLEIYKQCSKKKEAMKNPHGFSLAAVKIIKDRLQEHLVNGIKYEKINEWYEMSQLETEIESWIDNMEPAGHSVYDHVIFESEVERKFVQDLEKRKDVILYIKLPGWFKVETPVGEYNPDWAIVMEERDEYGEVVEKLYLVRETKGTTEISQLRPEEQGKIKCGKSHFAALNVNYKILTKAEDLP